VDPLFKVILYTSALHCRVPLNLIDSNSSFKAYYIKEFSFERRTFEGHSWKDTLFIKRMLVKAFGLQKSISYVQLLAHPNYPITGPYNLITGPYPLISGPYYLITRPYYLITGPYSLISGPYCLITRPYYLITGPYSV